MRARLIGAVIATAVAATSNVALGGAPVAGAVGPTSIAGVVTDAGTGEPIAGVEVDVLIGSSLATGATEVATAVTDASGGYTIQLAGLATAADPVTVDLVDPAGAFGASYANAVALVDDDTVFAPFALGAGGRVTGTVTGLGAGPLAGVCVTVRNSATQLVVPAGLAGSCTDARGAYTLPALSSGTYTLTFASPDPAAWQAIPAQQVTVVAGAVAVADASLLPVRATSITGVVTELGTDAPLAGIDITATATDTAGAPQTLTATTDATGAFTLPIGFQPGSPFSIDVVDPTGAHHPSLANTISVQAGYTEAIGVTLQPSSVTPTVDVSVSGTFTTVIVGQPAVIEVVVSNAGPTTAADVVTTTQLPPTVALDAVSAPAGFTCSSAGFTVTCTAASLAAKRSATIRITVSASVPAFLSSATTSVQTSSVDVDPTDNSLFQFIAVQPDQASVAVLLFDRPLEIGISAPVAFGVTNLGPSTAKDVFATVRLPEGLTIDRVDASGWSCAIEGREVGCSIPALAQGERLSALVYVTPSVLATDLPVSAIAGTSSVDPFGADDAIDATIDVVPVGSVDVGVSAAPMSASVPVGRDVAVRFGVTNNGPATATDVALAIDVPEGLDIVSAADASGALACVIAGRVVTCTAPTLARDARSNPTVVVRPTAPGGPFTVPASLTTSSSDIGVQPDAASAGPFSVVPNEVDLSVFVAAGLFAIGEQTAVSAFISNSAAISASDVEVTITVPDGLTIVGADPSFLFQSCTVEGQVVRCTARELGANLFGFPAATLRLVAGALATGEIAASIASSATDINPSNNRSTAQVVVVQPSADLVVSAFGPFAVQAGQDATISVSISSNGPVIARDVELVVDVPANFTPLAGDGFGASCAIDGSAVRCVLHDIAPGGTAFVVVTARADGPGGTPFRATASSSVPDPVPGNSTANAFVQVLEPVTELGTFVNAPSEVVAGEPADAVVALQNASVVAARDVVLTIAATGGSVSAVSPSPSALTCEVVDGVARCTADSFGAFQFANTIVTFVAAEGASTVTIEATISSTTPDAFPFNNVSTGTVQVRPAGTTDLAALLSIGGDFVEGRATDVRIGVANFGPSSVAAATVSFTPGEPYEIVSIAADPGVDCSAALGTVSCTAANLPAGSNGEATVTLRPTTQSFFTVLAVTVAGAPFDPNPFNDATSVFAAVVADESNLQVQANVPALAEIGSEITVLVDVFNAGPASADGAEVDVEVPTALEWIDDGACTLTAATTLRCPVPPIGRFGAATLALTFFVASATQSADVRFTVTAGNVDPFTFDNVFVPRITTVPPGSVDLRASAPIVPGLFVGQPEAIVLSAIHAGPSADAAADVHVVGTFPDNVRPEFATGLFPFDSATCTIDGQVVDCVLPSLPASATFFVWVVVRPLAPAPFPSLVVDVSSTSFDPLPDNNRASGAIEVLPFDAQLTLQANEIDAVGVGEPVQASAFVFNAGNAPSSNGSLRITPAAGLVVTDPVVFGAPEPCVADGTGWVCPLQVLSRFFGASLFYNVTGIAEGPSSVTIEVSADNDVSPEDNTAVVPVQVYPAGSADLFVNLSSLTIGANGEQLVTASFGQFGPSFSVANARLRIDLPGLEASDIFSFGADMTCAPEPEAVVCDIREIGRFTFGFVQFGTRAVRDAFGAEVVATISGGFDPNPVNDSGRSFPYDARVTPSAPTIVYVQPRDSAVEMGLASPQLRGEGVIDYIVEYSTDGGQTWQVGTDPGPADETPIGFNVTGLTNGVTYVFRVAAVNAFGRGDWSEISAPVTPSLPPRTPSNLEARAGNGQVTLTWRAPSQRGRNPITDYVIQYSTDRGRTWSTFEDGVSTATRTVVTDLTNGTRYVFRVAAVNDAGQSRFTEPTGSVTPRAR